MITERERLLIRMMLEEGPPCPYFVGVPLEGGHGPKTCNKGCWDEPGCDSFDAQWTMSRDHPDLLDAVVLAEARRQVYESSEISEHPEHPLHAWLAERDPDYAAWLAEKPWGE
jgi:hypothetical protein